MTASDTLSKRDPKPWLLVCYRTLAKVACRLAKPKPQTRCAVKGPGWGQDKLRADYACKSICGGTCEDSGSWHKNGEDWKGCAWVSIFPEKRCSVRGADKVLAATACPDSCA